MAFQRSSKELKVISGPERDGIVRIKSGPYMIQFVQNRDGSAERIGFIFQGQILESTYIPPEHYVPAARMANMVLRGRRRSAKRRAKKTALQRSFLWRL